MKKNAILFLVFVVVLSFNWIDGQVRSSDILGPSLKLQNTQILQNTVPFDDTPQESNHIFSLLPQYRLIEEIGRGACGMVYLVEDKKDPGSRLVLKVPVYDQEKGIKPSVKMSFVTEIGISKYYDLLMQFVKLLVSIETQKLTQVWRVNEQNTQKDGKAFSVSNLNSATVWSVEVLAQELEILYTRAIGSVLEPISPDLQSKYYDDLKTILHQSVSQIEDFFGELYEITQFSSNEEKYTRALEILLEQQIKDIKRTGGMVKLNKNEVQKKADILNTHGNVDSSPYESLMKIAKIIKIYLLKPKVLDFQQHLIMRLFGKTKKVILRVENSEPAIEFQVGTSSLSMFEKKKNGKISSSSNKQDVELSYVFYIEEEEYFLVDGSYKNNAYFELRHKKTGKKYYVSIIQKQTYVLNEQEHRNYLQQLDVALAFLQHYAPELGYSPTQPITITQAMRDAIPYAFSHYVSSGELVLGETIPKDYRKIPYLVMDYIEGKHLDKIIFDILYTMHQERPLKKSESKFDSRRMQQRDVIQCISEVVKIVNELVQLMHLSGFNHRDIKPENIVGSANGRQSLRILDLGITKMQGEDKTEHDFLDLGTPMYADPYQLIQALCKYIDTQKDIIPFPQSVLEWRKEHDKLDVGIDARSDIYSVAMTLIWTFTGGKYPSPLSSIQGMESIIQVVEDKLQDPMINQYLSKTQSDIFFGIRDFFAHNRFQIPEILAHGLAEKLYLAINPKINSRYSKILFFQNSISVAFKQTQIFLRVFNAFIENTLQEALESTDANLRKEYFQKVKQKLLYDVGESILHKRTKVLHNGSRESGGCYIDYDMLFSSKKAYLNFDIDEDVPAQLIMSPECVLIYAMCCMEEGDSVRAQKYFSQLLKIWPDRLMDFGSTVNQLIARVFLDAYVTQFNSIFIYAYDALERKECTLGVTLSDKVQLEERMKSSLQGIVQCVTLASSIYPSSLKNSEGLNVVMTMLIRKNQRETVNACVRIIKNKKIPIPPVLPSTIVSQVGSFIKEEFGNHLEDAALWMSLVLNNKLEVSTEKLGKDVTEKLYEFIESNRIDLVQACCDILYFSRIELPEKAIHLIKNKVIQLEAEESYKYAIQWYDVLIARGSDDLIKEIIWKRLVSMIMYLGQSAFDEDNSLRKSIADQIRQECKDMIENGFLQTPVEFGSENAFLMYTHKFFIAELRSYQSDILQKEYTTISTDGKENLNAFLDSEIAFFVSEYLKLCLVEGVSCKKPVLSYFMELVEAFPFLMKNEKVLSYFIIFFNLDQFEPPNLIPFFLEHLDWDILMQSKEVLIGTNESLVQNFLFWILDLCQKEIESNKYDVMQMSTFISKMPIVDNVKSIQLTQKESSYVNVTVLKLLLQELKKVDLDSCNGNINTLLINMKKYLEKDVGLLCILSASDLSKEEINVLAQDYFTSFIGLIQRFLQGHMLEDPQQVMMQLQTIFKGVFFETVLQSPENANVFVNQYFLLLEEAIRFQTVDTIDSEIDFLNVLVEKKLIATDSLKKQYVKIMQRLLPLCIYQSKNLAKMQGYVKRIFEYIPKLRENKKLQHAIHEKSIKLFDSFEALMEYLIVYPSLQDSEKLKIIAKVDNKAILRWFHEKILVQTAEPREIMEYLNIFLKLDITQDDIRAMAQEIIQHIIESTGGENDCEQGYELLIDGLLQFTKTMSNLETAKTPKVREYRIVKHLWCLTQLLIIDPLSVGMHKHEESIVMLMKERNSVQERENFKQVLTQGLERLLQEIPEYRSAVLQWKMYAFLIINLFQEDMAEFGKATKKLLLAATIRELSKEEGSKEALKVLFTFMKGTNTTQYVLNMLIKQKVLNTQRLTLIIQNNFCAPEHITAIVKLFLKIEQPSNQDLRILIDAVDILCSGLLEQAKQAKKESNTEKLYVLSSEWIAKVQLLFHARLLQADSMGDFCEKFRDDSQTTDYILFAS